MPRYIDHQTWDEYNKYSKETTLRGIAKFDMAIESELDLETLVAQANQLHKQRWQKVMRKLECKSVHEVPRKIVSQLNEYLAGDLREIYGKNRSDASHEQPLRSFDMVKAAGKLGVTPGTKGWEQLVIDAISSGEIRS